MSRLAQFCFGVACLFTSDLIYAADFEITTPGTYNNTHSIRSTISLSGTCENGTEIAIRVTSPVRTGQSFIGYFYPSEPVTGTTWSVDISPNDIGAYIGTDGLDDFYFELYTFGNSSGSVDTSHDAVEIQFFDDGNPCES